MHIIHSSILWLWHNELAYTIIAIVGLLLISTITYWLSRIFLRTSVKRFILRNHTVHQKDVTVTRRIALLAATLVFAGCLNLLTGLPSFLDNALRLGSTIFCIICVALLLSELLDAINSIWSKKSKVQYRSIKGYVQLSKIILVILTIILVLATLTGRPPGIILSGFGAAAAVLMLIFQHTILSFVANIQISSSKAISLGDWVEIPVENINGEVIDIALHTVKIRNWDNTIARVPMRNFITESWINWQPMFSSGGRRIKRSFFVDQNSIGFATDELLKHLRATFMSGEMPEKGIDQTHVQEDEDALSPTRLLSMSAQELINAGITNLGLMRAHILHYLKNRDDIVSNMYILVRYLAPTSEGLPVEIYCFTSKVFWMDFEEVQAELSEYIYAIFAHFNLKIFQAPTGEDLGKGIERLTLNGPRTAATDTKVS
ncbi:hypothetical protein LMG33818_001221 [Halomonadaceae bacterium LMG 33818]|uniref:mechanosensitive ion channel family protein n=1 Tax=Cernens ardua TaxID=3402176 RepID=UPI003EDB8AB1